MGESIPRPDPVPRCMFRNPHYGDLCGVPAVGEWESPDGKRVPYCKLSAPKEPSERWHPYADSPAPVAALPETAGEPPRCECQSCPWHLRDWPRCVLPEGHGGAHDPGPGPHAWVPAAEMEAAREQVTNILRALCYEAGGITLRDTVLAMDAAACEAHLRAVLTRHKEAVETARAEGYLAGRKFEHAALCDMLRKFIDLEDDECVHYEREVAELERRAKANRECAEASRARADGLRALLARVEALS